MDGIVIINKPAGMTSFDVIAKLRKIFGTRKAGHAGTLDPDAEGVLPVCIDRATKVIEFLMEKDKAYSVVLRLGVRTDTQDASGNIIETKPIHVSDEEIIGAVKAFEGDIMQTPPMYSAVRIGGKRLYEMARQGIEIEREARPVTIKSIGNIRVTAENGETKVFFDVECSKGTYIRTLCDDIGLRLGCGGHMEHLLRTRSGPFRLENAVTLEELQSARQNNTLGNYIMRMDTALAAFPAVEVDSDQARRLKNGLAVRYDTCLPSGSMVGVYRSEMFLAIGKMIDDNGLFLKSHKWMEA